MTDTTGKLMRHDSGEIRMARVGLVLVLSPLAAVVIVAMAAWGLA